MSDSTRPGTLGGPDIYTAMRGSSDDAWPAATHLAAIRSAAPDTCASLSWDGSFMVFGSRPGRRRGAADIYVTTRAKVTGRDVD